MDSTPSAAKAAPSQSPKRNNDSKRSISDFGEGRVGAGSSQLLFDRQFDRFHAAIDAELVEDVRNVEFDSAQD